MQRSRSFRPIASVVALFGLALSGVVSSSSLPATSPMPAALRHRHDPAKLRAHRDDGLWESSNWSGYAVTGTNVTVASGSWVVPTVTCTSTTSNQYSSFWVGIDGFNSNTVEQTGTDSDCSRKTPSYYAWYEFYPKSAYLVNTSAIGTIAPGTSMTSTITYDAGTDAYTVTLRNNTTGNTFSTSAKVSGAARSSGEWIAEAPSGQGGVLQVANFGTMFFTGAAATVAGTSGNITSFLEPGCADASCSNVVQELTMVQTGGAGAQPTALNNTGDGFSVRYVGPTTPPKKHGH